MKFASTEDVMSAADNCSAAQISEFYLDVFEKVEQLVRGVLNSGGSLLNKISV
jgi:hypothetical protein